MPEGRTFRPESIYQLLFNGASLKLFREGIGKYSDKLKKFRDPGNTAIEKQLTRNEHVAQWLDEEIAKRGPDWDLEPLPAEGELLILLKSTLPYLLEMEVAKRAELEKDSEAPPEAFEAVDTRIAKIQELQEVGLMKQVPTRPLLGGADSRPAPTKVPPRLLIIDERLQGTVRKLDDEGKNNDRAVDDAVTELEDRIRTVTGLPTSDYGSGLLKKAFNPTNGLLVLSENAREQEGFWQLYEGFFKSHRNATGHRRLEYSRQRAIQIINFADYLIGLLEGATQRTRPHSPGTTK